jgi:hydrogenase maturation protein HypF
VVLLGGTEGSGKEASSEKLTRTATITLSTALTAEQNESLEASPNATNRCVLIRVRGIVQGVGFRPFIFQLAHQHGLDGWVRNQSDGVEIEAAGLAGEIEQFIQDIPSKAPPLARVVEVDVSERVFRPLERFHIVKSKSEQSRSTLIAPDVCTCRDCLRELHDPRDRRYRYPFINCTNCGPRYTIIKDIPYDRDKTTMARFSMCPTCQAEYDNPLDRRFHAQPNACWECGPEVWLEAPDGGRLAGRERAIDEAVARLQEGSIVAIKGLGGFHLAVLATDESAVSRLRSRKIREEKPFAVMFSDLDAIKRTCEMSSMEAELLRDPKRPIVLLKRKPAHEGNAIAPSVAPRNRFIGAFLPYTPVHYLLFQGSSYQALVMTSGNQSDEPIVMSNEEARERLGNIADFFLLHNRDIYMRCDDSVTRVLHGEPRPLRRARGYVPVPIFMGESTPSVLGVGAELKNTVCLTRGKEAFLSQHIGDLENLETLHSFEHAIAHLEKILEIKPECIAHDLHPDYLSTQWALSQDHAPRLAVQHHHAHIASVVAEQKVSGPILGLAMDGTGYGTDGTIWGGEILLVEGDQFERLGHFRTMPLPGGAKAIKEPWRMALAYLWRLDPEHLREEFKDFLNRWPQEKVQIVVQMLERNINTPMTSSCGRLFDAVSSLAGLRDTITYEGQAAIELEQAIEEDSGRYEGGTIKAQGIWILDPLPMISQVIKDVRSRLSPGIISARFHNGMASLLAGAAQRVSLETGLKRIALSGGVFQNAYLFENLVSVLVERGFEVYSHVEVPANDACIALGQAYVAAHWLMKRNRTKSESC